MFVRFQRETYAVGAEPPSVGAGLTRDGSRACMLASALAWSVEKQIPPADAIRALPFFMRFRFHIGAELRLVAAFARCTVGLLWWPYWVLGLRWSWGLNQVVRDLDEGMLLGAAMRRSMRGLLPGYFLHALEDADRSGRHHIVLPLLAERLRYPGSVARDRSAISMFAAARLLGLVFTVFFLSAVIVPRFELIFSDLMNGASRPMGFVSALADWTVILGAPVLLLGTALYLAMRLPIVADNVCVHLPFFGRERRELLLCQVAHAMVVYLRQGYDVVDAAAWCARDGDPGWMQRRARRFHAALQSGAPWHEAWREMKLGGLAGEWVLRNAAGREDPISGFQTLVHWSQQSIDQRTRRLERWLDPVCVVVTAAIVGPLCASVFLACRDLIEGLT